MYYGQVGIVPISAASPKDFPLLSSKVHYDLVDVQSLATFVLTYASNASVAADVNYVCPLPSDASVCSFKAVIDGNRTIKGIVKEKAKAKAEYDAAVAQGKTAALLEQNNIEVFQVSLGNIRPKQVIDIYISFVSLIASDGTLDSVRLIFPSVITSRYGTPPNELLSSASRIRPIKSTLDFSVSVQMTSHIKSITSPSHPISMTLGSSKLDSGDDFDPCKAHVALTSSNHLDKDIVIVVTCQGTDRPRCTVESFSPEEGSKELTDAYSLTLVPRFEPPPLPKQEYVFLVDRSGSMEGEKILAVRSALQIMLRSLPSNDTTFNIFSFGSDHDSLWPSSVAYGAESLKVAASHVDGMNADYGGTEIRSALRAVLETHNKDQDIPLTVFVLTDGEAYDLDGVQSTVAEHVNRYKEKKNFLRVFCMGIGNSVSRAMCDMIARVGQGAVVYVGEDEKPDKKLITLLRAARGPIITNVTVDWTVESEDAIEEDFELVPSQPQSQGKAPSMSLFDEKAVPKDDVALGPQTNIKLPPPPRIQQAPTAASLPTLYPGFRTNIFAIIRRDNDAAPSRSVRVKGTVRGRTVELDIPVTAAMKTEVSSDFDSIKLLHILAARALVQRFEDEGKKAGFMSDRLKAEVVRAAERYGIASSETSFVAVDEEGSPVAVSGLTMKAEYDLVQQSFRGFSFIPYEVTSGAADEDLSEDFIAYSSPYNSLDAYPQIVSVNSDSLDVPAYRHSAFVSEFSAPVNFAAMAHPTAPAPPPPVLASSGSSAFIATDETSQWTDDSPVQIHYRGVSPTGSSPPSFRTPSRFSNNISEELESADTPSQDLPLSIESVARHQTFEGSFDGSPLLYKLLVKQDTLPALPDALKQLEDTGVSIWCSILCIVFIQTKFPDDGSIWELMVEKGEGWINNALTGHAGEKDTSTLVDELKREAKKSII